MSNMFRCTLASGGTLILTVTCDSVFAGQTITCTDGTTTLTQICPSTSPYTVEFRIPNSGIWTISSGTASTSVTIPSSAALHDIPNGSTITPTDDIQTWLHCANIWDKAYTTISQVLADASTVQALVASDNAVDYMKRSTTWANDVTTDSSAMTYIGANDYCANKLLEDSTWRAAICSSNYYENVLTTKIPTMTSNTTPSGTASASSIWGGGLEAYKAFDNNNSTAWASASGKSTGEWLQYTFTNEVKILKMYYYLSSSQTNYPTQLKIQAYYNGAWNDVKTVSVGKGEFNFNIDQYNIKSAQWRIYCTQRAGSNNINVNTVQFYGRVA